MGQSKSYICYKCLKKCGIVYTAEDEMSEDEGGEDGVTTHTTDLGEDLLNLFHSDSEDEDFDGFTPDEL